MTHVAEPLDRYFTDLERPLRGGKTPAWLPRAREQARSRFQSLGFPTAADEEWRFTTVAPIAETHFARALDGAGKLGRADLAPFRLADLASAELVFVNGRYA